MVDEKYCIIGLGWLGFALAKHMLHDAAMHDAAMHEVTMHQRKIQVSGTVRTAEKQRALAEHGITIDKFSLYEFVEQTQDNKNDSINLFKHLKNAKVVLNIPPGRKNFDKEAYTYAMKKLIDTIFYQGAQRLVFISTTSVYGKQSGVINELSQVHREQASTDSARAHIDIENHLYTHYKDDSYILRPAGLVGPNLLSPNMNAYRHPINTLCHKRDIPFGNDPVNLVHQYDVIQAIIALLRNKFNHKVNHEDNQKASQHAFNIAANDHPSREEYYTWCAKQLGLPIPTFLPDPGSASGQKRTLANLANLAKLIDAESTFSLLGITPKFNSVYQMLPNGRLPIRV